MIIGYGGTPRSGKTYSAVKDWYLPAIKAGINGNPRPIYTNISGIKDEACIKATSELTGASVEQINQQVNYVDESWFLNVSTKCTEGALIIADEAHIFWCSREWKSFTDTARNWFAESGKIYVDIVWISQTQSSIEKWITGRTELIHHAMNLALIGMPKRFVLRTRNGESSQILSKKFVKIERSVYNCYASYTGSNPYDTPKREKSRFFSWKLALGIIAFFLLLSFSLRPHDLPDDAVNSSNPIEETLNTHPEARIIHGTSLDTLDVIGGILDKYKAVYEGYMQYGNKFVGSVSFYENDQLFTRLSFLDLKVLGVGYSLPFSRSHFLTLNYKGKSFYAFTREVALAPELSNAPPPPPTSAEGGF